MCGICGTLNLELRPVGGAELVERMSAQLEHRGPDSRGTFQRPGLALGIRRLSIIDLETGDQPLSTESGQVSWVVNGEIYNYRELRQELLGRGHRFKTKSDAEVVGHLYEETGEDCLGKLNGMFALALWDESRQRLLLARDRAGEKPLFYWRGGAELIFASEVKALLECPRISRTLNPSAVERYCLYGYIPSPETALAEIRKLPAANRMVIERGAVRIEPYWELKNYPQSGRAAATRTGPLKEELLRRLQDAASSRLVSDVPLGVFLSGGVDSSALVALMSEFAPGNVTSFTIGFPQASFNEADYAARVARHFRTKHHVVAATETSLRESLEFLTGFLDEPLGDPAILPTYLLSRFARGFIKVALSGEGGDELFGGYPTYLGHRIAESFLRVPKFLRRRVFERLAKLLPTSGGAVPLSLFIRRFLDHCEEPSSRRHHIWLGAFPPAVVQQLFSREWRAQHGSTELFAPVEETLAGTSFEDSLLSLLYMDFQLYLADDLLVKIDRASMACSLELRTPFLDQRLVEFMTSLPAAHKVHGFKTKYLFKKALQGRLPSAILHRQKRGFSVPVAEWLRGSLKPLVEEVLGKDKLARDGIFDPEAVHRLLEEHWSRRADHRRGLWALLMFQLWHERWVRRSTSQAGHPT